jgi:hypothetical protein
MIRAGAARIPRSLAKEHGHLCSMSRDKLFHGKTFGSIRRLQKLQQRLQSPEPGRLRTLRVLEKSVHIAANISVEIFSEASGRVEQFHDKNHLDLARPAAKGLFGAALAGSVHVWNPVSPARIVALSLRLILHQPRLAAILWQANCPDANPSLREFAPGPLAFPIENRKAGLLRCFCNPVSAKTPSKDNFGAPRFPERETKRKFRFDPATAALRTKVFRGQAAVVYK